ncbi:MAG: helix-turn-helix domain-containing protein [Candidatus Saelkia tenebricola]|nr:helix-turn-helix domain-containing protein [Candidatus Saelkia tenebricola]
MIINTKKEFYSVREVAELLGISKQTLLRYEKKGCFPRAKRNPINKWREYAWGDVQKLKKILGRE